MSLKEKEGVKHSKPGLLSDGLPAEGSEPKEVPWSAAFDHMVADSKVRYTVAVSDLGRKPDELFMYKKANEDYVWEYDYHGTIGRCLRDYYSDTVARFVQTEELK